MRKRGQAALEFLLTYGWMIMVVLVAIGALAYFGVLSPDNFIPRRCVLEPGLACIDFKIQEDSVTLILMNGKGEDISISSIGINDCTDSVSGVLKNGEKKAFVVGGCNNTEGKRFMSQINVTLAGEAGLTHKNIGSLVDKVESGCGLCACQNIDTNCGSYPLCQNCNSLDNYSGNYCSGGNIVRDFNDYSCSSNQCISSSQAELVESCTSGVCQNAQCVCSNTDTNCGSYPSCQNCNNLDSHSGNYCNGNDVYSDFNDYSCSSNQCASSTTPQLVQSCGGQTCQSGSCVSGGGDGGGEGGSCFPAGTKITMSDGSLKNIEDVKVNDKILAYDLKTKEAKPAKVLELEAPMREGYYLLNNGLLRVTDEHPLYVRKLGGVEGWASINPEKTEDDTELRPILKLELGDEIFTLKHGFTNLTSIEYVKGILRTYNLKTIEDYNTFFADNVLVHNKDSIVQGTFILLYNRSYEKIEDLHDGDIVLSYNINSKKFEPSKVISIDKYYSNDYILINSNIKVTKKHPLGKIVNGSVQWVYAELVKENDFIFSVGKPSKINSIKKIDSTNSIGEYDVKVSVNGNYFLSDGENSYLVIDENYMEK